VDAEGRTGKWSAVKPIEAALRPPEPIAPRDGAPFPWDTEGNTVTLSWTASEVVREYALEIARDASFSDLVSARRTSDARVELELPGTGRYFWRVRAIDLTERETAPSAPRSFTVLPPPEPRAPPQPAATLVLPEPVLVAPAEPEPILASVPATRVGTTPVALPAGDGRFGVGVLAGWTTSLGALSAPTIGAEGLWRSGPGGLALSLRASWSSATATVPVQPGLSAPVDARAQIFPLSLLALHEWQLPWSVLHAGAGLSAQLAYLSVGGDSALEAAAGISVAAGASRRLGAGEVLAELSFSTGSVDGSLGSLRTGGFQVLGGYRFRP
jgi:hypothetical protein